jgi:hypothetical protein
MQRRQRVYRQLGVQQALVLFQIIEKHKSFASLLKILDPSTQINLLASVLTNQWVSGRSISCVATLSGGTAP